MWNLERMGHSFVSLTTVIVSLVEQPEQCSSIQYDMSNDPRDSPGTCIIHIAHGIFVVIAVDRGFYHHHHSCNICKLYKTRKALLYGCKVVLFQLTLIKRWTIWIAASLVTIRPQRSRELYLFITRLTFILDLS